MSSAQASPDRSDRVPIRAIAVSIFRSVCSIHAFPDAPIRRNSRPPTCDRKACRIGHPIPQPHQGTCPLRKSHEDGTGAGPTPARASRHLPLVTPQKARVWSTHWLPNIASRSQSGTNVRPRPASRSSACATQPFTRSSSPANWLPYASSQIPNRPTRSVLSSAMPHPSCVSRCPISTEPLKGEVIVRIFPFAKILLQKRSKIACQVPEQPNFIILKEIDLAW